MPTPNRPSDRRSDARRTPEALLDQLQERSRRRIAGGLIVLHRRGKTQLGAAWVPLASVGAGAALLGGLRAARSAARAVGALAIASKGNQVRALSNLALFEFLTR